MADDAARSNTPFGPSTPRESSTATADGSTAAALATPDEAALAAGVDDPEGLGELGSPAGETSAHASPGAAGGDAWWAAGSGGHPDGRTEEGEDPASSDAVDYGIAESSSAGGLSDGRSPNMPATSTAPPERGPFLDGFTDAPPAVDRPAVTAREPSSSLSSGEDRASEARALVERLPESWSLNTGDGNSWMVPETAELDRVERAAPPVTTLSATLATAVAAETAAFIENETASLPGGPPDDAFLQTLGLEAAEEVAPTVTAPTPAEEPVEADEPTLERERVLAGEPTARNTERLGAIPESEAAGHIASAMPEETTKPEAAAAEPEPEPEAPASSGPDGHDDGETAAERQSAFRTPVVTVRAGGITGSGRETLRANLSRLGAALGGAAVDRAETVGAEFDAVVADLGDRAPGGGPSAYLGYVGRQREGLTRTLPSYPPFSLVGVGNVASGASGTPASDGGPVRADVTLDRIAEWDPEYLFVDRGTQRYDALSRSSLRSVRAIRDNHVYGLVPTSDYGPDVSVALANAYYVGSVCYPKAFDLDPKLTANSVYERLLGASVHDELVDAYGGGYGGVSAR